MGLREEETGLKQFFVCQVFIVKTINGRSTIALLEAFHLSNIEEAIRKAERMNEAQHIVGSIAFSIFVDEEAGEYSEMQNINQFGSVPSLEAL
ncbi:MAG: hypothetical protein COB24_11345 [Hyphomicrobiales bacterium]|nr:MAG: hypothetical protein COB24_11345 [Hyphomicrobiales bacterium]